MKNILDQDLDVRISQVRKLFNRIKPKREITLLEKAQMWHKVCSICENCFGGSRFIWLVEDTTSVFNVSIIDKRRILTAETISIKYADTFRYPNIDDIYKMSFSELKQLKDDAADHGISGAMLSHYYGWENGDAIANLIISKRDHERIIASENSKRIRARTHMCSCWSDSMISCFAICNILRENNLPIIYVVLSRLFSDYSCTRVHNMVMAIIRHEYINHDEILSIIRDRIDWDDVNKRLYRYCCYLRETLIRVCNCEPTHTDDDCRSKRGILKYLDNTYGVQNISPDKRPRANRIRIPTKERISTIVDIVDKLNQFIERDTK